MREESHLPQSLGPQYRGSLSFIRARMEAFRVALRDASESFASELLNNIGPLELQLLDSHDLSSGVDFYELVRDFEISLVRRALFHSGGSQRRAAALLRIKPTTLNAKIKAYGIQAKPAIKAAPKLARWQLE